MKQLLILLALLTGLQLEVLSQPFDTLLLQYNYLNEIFPLEDGTFILIGVKDGIVVERINSRAESIWTIHIGRENDIETQSIIHLNESDSSIQIQAIPVHCDLVGDGTFKVFTIKLDGTLSDSLYIANEGYSDRCTLLSGRNNLPRLAYFRDEKVILCYSDGDTLELKLTLPEDDSTSFFFQTGHPKLVGMYPNGNLLVGTTGGIAIWYRPENARYEIYDRTLVGGLYNATQMFCISDETYTLLSNSGLTLYERLHPIRSFYPEENYNAKVKLQGSEFLFQTNTITGEDSLYILDHHLNVIYKEPKEFTDQYISSYAVTDSFTFKVGAANAIWIEGGFLGSINHNTGGGPKFYDVNLLDFSLSSYDYFDVQLSCEGFNYKYNFPEVQFTIQNNGDFPVSQTTILFVKFCFCPTYETWLRTIDNMNLAPGETKTYSLYDVEIESRNSFYDPIFVCFDLLRPDNHADDNTWPGNSLCKDSEIESARPFEDGERIRFYPNPVQHVLHILTSDDSEYSYQLYYSDGSLIDTRDLIKGGPNEINLSSIPPGVYFIRFIFVDGYKETAKVVKT